MAVGVPMQQQLDVSYGRTERDYHSLSLIWFKLRTKDSKFIHRMVSSWSLVDIKFEVGG